MLQNCAKVGLGLASFLSFDAGVRALMASSELDKSLPTGIVGMLGAFTCLSTASMFAPGAAATCHSMLMPGVGWVNRWLPVFLVPVQVMLPTIKFPGGLPEAAGLMLLVGGGWLGSMVFAAWLVKVAQAFMPAVANVAASAAGAPPRITMRLPAMWLSLALLALPASISTVQDVDSMAKQWLPVESIDISQFSRGAFLASLGVGSFSLGLQRGIAGHVCFLICGGATIAGAAAIAAIRGESFETVVRRDYITSHKNGAGDWLLWFLSPALVATGVQMFLYRARIFRYGFMVAGCCTVVSLVNILGTVAVAPYLGVSPSTSIAATMRCVTIPMGLPTYSRLCSEEGVEGNVALVALCAGISGFLGFTCSKAILSSILCSTPVTQPVTRGIAAGAAAHVLGVAGFAATEQEAFIWGMLAMAASGISSASWICACPPVMDLTLKMAHRGEVHAQLAHAD